MNDAGDLNAADLYIQIHRNVWKNVKNFPWDNMINRKKNAHITALNKNIKANN